MAGLGSLTQAMLSVVFNRQVNGRFPAQESTCSLSAASLRSHWPPTRSSHRLPASGLPSTMPAHLAATPSCVEDARLGQCTQMLGGTLAADRELLRGAGRRCRSAIPSDALDDRPAVAVGEGAEEQACGRVAHASAQEVMSASSRSSSTIGRVSTTVTAQPRRSRPG